MRVLAVVLIAACGPAPQATLLAARDRGDEAAMRAHGWQLWSTLAWDGWTPTEQLFGDAPPGRPRLRTPRPFRNGDAIDRETLPVMFDVLFDPSAAAHVRAHGLGHRATLAELAVFPEFPADAIAVKLVWYPIHATGFTAMPIWDGEAEQLTGNPDRSWQRAVAVDPTRATIPDGETAAVELEGRAFTARVVPLVAFEHHALESAGELASARTASGDTSLTRDDFVALVAAHVTTKAIPDWTWATYWWHDRPDDGAFAAGRPAAVRGAARSYLMDVTFSADGACFNPWLEARFPSGEHSNCVTCHQRAVVGAADYLPVTRDRLRDDDPYFAGRPRTDFVWSIALESR